MEFKIIQDDDHVASVEASDMEEVFKIANLQVESKITRFEPMRSISVGDVIVDEDGKSFLVNNVGFSEVIFFEVRRGFVCDESPWTEDPSFCTVGQMPFLNDAWGLCDKLNAENDQENVFFSVFKSNGEQVFGDDFINFIGP